MRKNGRVLSLLFWDMRFQARYGFYLLYTFLTILYAAVILALPEGWKGKAASTLIFSDPAAMGLFFMGAIVLLEKSQRVTSFFAITPMKPLEYVASKVLSLNIIAMVVAAILAVASGSSSVLSAVVGTFLSGTMFTLCGVIVATRITSLNQFILATVPVEIVGFVPALLHLFGVTPAAAGLYPANACMDLVAGRSASLLGLMLTVALIVLLFIAACRLVLKMWQEQGGVKI
jgi:fluoroquinolone transport system permease protein